MSKDSQLDPKEVRKMKAKGGHTMAESALTARAETIKSNPATVINAVTISSKRTRSILCETLVFIYKYLII